jgi:hypothetical protein
VPSPISGTITPVLPSSFSSITFQYPGQTLTKWVERRLAIIPPALVDVD